MFVESVEAVHAAMTKTMNGVSVKGVPRVSMEKSLRMFDDVTSKNSTSSWFFQ